MRRSLTHQSRARSPEAKTLIETLPAADPTITVDEIAERLRRECGISPHRSTIYYHLHRSGFLPKVPVRTAPRQSLDQLRDFQQRLDAVYTYDRRQLVFLDETAITWGNLQPRRVWGRKGEPVAVRQVVSHNTPRVSVLAAYAVEGFIAAVATRGTFNAASFEEFLFNVLGPEVGMYPGPHSLIVLDNCSIHKVSVLESFAQRYGCRVLFTAPYWPATNPIEEGWAHLKRELRRHQEEYATNAERTIEFVMRLVGDYASDTIRDAGY